MQPSDDPLGQNQLQQHPENGWDAADAGVDRQQKNQHCSWQQQINQHHPLRFMDQLHNHAP